MTPSPARSLSGTCSYGPRISVLMAHGVACFGSSGSFFGRLSPRSPFCQHFKRYRARRSFIGRTGTSHAHHEFVSLCLNEKIRVGVPQASGVGQRVQGACHEPKIRPHSRYVGTRLRYLIPVSRRQSRNVIRCYPGTRPQGLSSIRHRYGVDIKTKKLERAMIETHYIQLGKLGFLSNINQVAAKQRFLHPNEINELLGGCKRFLRCSRLSPKSDHIRIGGTRSFWLKDKKARRYEQAKRA